MMMHSAPAFAISRQKRPPNFGVKLMRPGFGRQPSCLLHRQRDGVTAVGAPGKAWQRGNDVM